MFKHILVPIDLSDKNARTLRTALMLATQNRARVTLLHVVQHVAHLPLSEMRPFYRTILPMAPPLHLSCNGCPNDRCVT